MAGTLNQRIHHERIDPTAATITVTRGQKVAVGDVIISGRNDPTIEFLHSAPYVESPPSVRNGNRRRVAAVDTETNCVADERLDDGARVVLDDGYLRDDISLGCAVTAHSAQGVNADTSHAVLNENTTRPLLHVAITRGRHTNTVHLYQRRGPIPLDQARCGL